MLLFRLLLESVVQKIKFLFFFGFFGFWIEPFFSVVAHSGTFYGGKCHWISSVWFKWRRLCAISSRSPWCPGAVRPHRRQKFWSSKWEGQKNMDSECPATFQILHPQWVRFFFFGIPPFFNFHHFSRFLWHFRVYGTKDVLRVSEKEDVAHPLSRYFTSHLLLENQKRHVLLDFALSIVGESCGVISPTISDQS